MNHGSPRFGARLLRPFALALTLAAGLTIALVPATTATASTSSSVLAAAPTARSGARASAANVAIIELDGAVRERSSPAGAIFGTSHGIVLRELQAALSNASENPGLKAVVLRIKDLAINQSQIDELAPSFAALRKAGKKLVVFAEGYGPPELLLGALGDEVLIQTGGEVSLPGMYVEELFLADAMRALGVEPSFVQIGDYKGASEMFANSAPSPQWSENIEGLMTARYDAMRQRLMDGRRLDSAKLDAAMENAWMATGEQGVKLGLIDRVLDLADLDEHIAKSLAIKPDQLEWDFDLLPSHESKLKHANPFTLLQQLFATPSNEPTRDTIAVLHIDGPIIDGESSRGGLMESAGVGSRSIRSELADLEDNDLVKGVIVRIDSPGGSAIASEIIWQGVKRLSEHKPVFVSVGSMAASGGYYIAVAGQRVYVNPSSIVGSIGVVGGKLGTKGLMDKLSIRTYSRSRGPHADLLASSKPWTDAQRALIAGKMRETYDLFTSRVSAGRAGIDLAKTAEGRLFLGQQAVDLKMADRVGGLEVAIADLAKQASLAPGSFDVMDFPPPPGLEDILSGMMGVSARARAGASANATAGAAILASDGAQALRALLGPSAWVQIESSLGAMMQLRREPVLLVAPSVLIFR
jgi:protease-4